MSKLTDRVRRTRDEWAGLVGAWEASGLSGEAFARDKDFSASSLYVWRKRLSSAEPPEVRDLSFVPVVVDEADTSRDAIGWRIETRAGVVVAMSGPGAKDGLEVAIRALGEQGALL